MLFEEKGEKHKVIKDDLFEERGEELQVKKVLFEEKGEKLHEEGVFEERRENLKENENFLEAKGESFQEKEEKPKEEPVVEGEKHVESTVKETNPAREVTPDARKEMQNTHTSPDHEQMRGRVEKDPLHVPWQDTASTTVPAAEEENESERKLREKKEKEMAFMAKVKEKKEAKKLARRKARLEAEAARRHQKLLNDMEGQN